MANEVSTLPNKRRVRIAVGILLLVFLTSVLLVQSLFAAGSNDQQVGLIQNSVNYYQDGDSQGTDVITGTRDFAEVLREYMDGHYLSDEESRAMGLDELDSLDAKVHFPAMFMPPLSPRALMVSRPNSSNHWTLSWTPQAGQGPFVYHLEEAQEEDFSDAVMIYEDSAPAFYVTNHPPSIYNVYYYRLRTSQGTETTDWSNSVRVVGGFRDDFINRKPPWKIKRTTHIDDVRSWYEPLHPTKPTWLIMQVNNAWDWGITGGWYHAPTPPYVIEYRAKLISPANLHSFGVVFGGNRKDGEPPCPDWSSVKAAYSNKNCFTKFYNTNFIWAGNHDMGLLFERVDRLVWCPDEGCDGGGSDMKRKVDWELKEDISGVEPNSWNTWRVEVRDSGIDMFGNGRHLMTYDDTRYIYNPYFGFFGSTNEYSGSTTRYDYIQIMPLDN